MLSVHKDGISCSTEKLNVAVLDGKPENSNNFFKGMTIEPLRIFFYQHLLLKSKETLRNSNIWRDPAFPHPAGCC